MDLRDIPFKNKPASNGYLQVAVLFVCFWFWPLTTMAVAFGVLLWCVMRAMWHTLRPEWLRLKH